MRFSARVIPRSSQEKIIEEKGSWKIYVYPAAEDGKANRRVCELVSEKLGVSKSKVKIIRGLTNRKKLIEVCDV